MRITDVRAIPVWLGHRNILLVKVETDAGILGLGESGLSGRERAVMGAIEHYREFVIGRDPMRAGALWQEMYRSQYFEGGRVLAAAISAIDLALYDIKGKALGVPVYELLGGRQRDRIPCFATTGSVDRAAELLDAGWDCIRFGAPSDPGDRPGRYQPREMIPIAAERLSQARDRLGSRVALGIDWHHRLSVAEAASFCDRLAPGTLDFLEEPIRDESPDAYASLRSMTNVPFAIGEEFASKWRFAPYIERGLTQFARVDICNVGGFTEAMKVAGWAEAHYIDLMPHDPLGPVCTAATIHLCAAAPNVSWLEAKGAYTSSTAAPADPDIFPVQPRLEGTSFPVSARPGLGVELNETAVAERGFAFWEPPHLRRDDGAYTNW